MQRRNTNRKINHVKDHIWIVWKGQMFKPKVIIMGGLDLCLYFNLTMIWIINDEVELTHVTFKWKDYVEVAFWHNDFF
jgi:hypothetical protein